MGGGGGPGLIYQGGQGDQEETLMLPAEITAVPISVHIRTGVDSCFGVSGKGKGCWRLVGRVLNG